nr:MAG TPA: hypothetical protein [Caudoviricetes sp.]
MSNPNCRYMSKPYLQFNTRSIKTCQNLPALQALHTCNHHFCFLHTYR